MATEITLRPAVSYTYPGQGRVLDACSTPEGAEAHLVHLLANGYDDAEIVTARQDGDDYVIVDCDLCGEPRPGIVMDRHDLAHCPDCPDRTGTARVTGIPLTNSVSETYTLLRYL